MHLKDEGVILNSHDSGGSDRIVVIFLKNTGKTSFVFKGIKKSKSRKLNSDDLGNHVEILYRKKNADQLPYIQEIKVRDHFYNIKKDHIKFLYLNCLAELFMNILPAQEGNLKVFNFLLKALMTLKRIQHQELEKFMVYIQYRLVQVSGILPDFKSCSHCHKEEDDLVYRLHFNELSCQKCHTIQDDLNIRISRKFIKMIDSINRHNIDKIEDLSIDKELIKIMDKVFKNIIIKYLNKELRSYKILQTILKDIGYKL
ncbi:MAG: DNA repair protein RecO [Spirochaetes bacterium]|nr:DNA repair protein RecO [Spirochaetota bacterium]